MDAMMQLKPMGIGDILDTAFRLYRKRFTTFAGIAVVVCLPSSVAAALVSGAARLFVPQKMPDDDTGLWNVVLSSFSRHPWAASAFARHGSIPGAPDGDLSALLALLASMALTVIGLLLAFLVVVSIAYPLCTGALVVNISASYLGETIGAGQSYARAFKKLWRLLVAQGTTTALVLLGLMLCVIPGLVLALQLLVVPQIVLLEDLKVWPAIGRSRSLLSDYLGKALLLTLVVGLFGIVAGEAISVTVHAVPWPLPIIGDFLSFFLLQMLMMPLSIATLVLLYYDLRIRKEAFDLERLAGSMVEFRS
jgi:hypothetical protein